MNVENATSDDSVKIDEDLVAALGFEPASDILIVDDALNDDLSISSDDIRVSTKDASSEVGKTTAKGERPPGNKSHKAKGKNKHRSSVDKPKQSNLEDRLNADSKTAGVKPSEARTTDAAAKAKIVAPPSAGTKAPDKDSKKSSTHEPQGTVDPEPVEAKKSGSSKTAGQVLPEAPAQVAAFTVVPPPPHAADAVLLSEPSPSTYSFSDVKLPDFKGAIARFTRNEEAPLDVEIDSGLNGDVAVEEASTTTPVLNESKTATVQSDSTIDARATSSPPTVGGPPVSGDAVTSPPLLAPEPDIQIVEVPAEPNVHRAPTRSGRTRIRSRKVRRQIRHIDPWSVLTFSVIFHACVFGALLLASVLVWRFADGAGLIENAESFWAALADKPDFEIDQGVLIRSAAMIAGLLAIASSVMMVLLTVFFNLISDIVGGIRVTVIEEEPVRITK